MRDEDRQAERDRPHQPDGRCHSIDWYSEGESRTIESDGVQVTVRFVGRKGRRGRIIIIVPPGATFWASDNGSVR